MPSTGSQQTMELQNELEERRKREEQERLAAQAAELAAAQKQQAAALQGQVQPGISAAQMAAGTQPAATTHDTDNGEDVEGVEVNRTVSTVMEQANRDMEQAAEDAAKANAAANTNYQNFLGKIVEGYQNELREAKKEAELQRQIDTTKSVFAGVTEFASALTNLIGTSRGAVNQQPRTVTQDWMREADQHRLQERERLDRMRDKLRQQEMAGENARHQFTKEQIAEQLNLRKLKGANAMGLAQQRKAEDDEANIRQANKMKQAAAAQQQETDNNFKEQQIAQGWARLKGDEQDRINDMLQKGYVPDKDAPSGYRLDPELAAQIQKYKGVTSGGGSDRRDLITWTDKDGKVQGSYLTQNELKDIYDNAPYDIRNELGEKELAEFERDMFSAATDADKRGVIKKWAGKSKRLDERIRMADPDYKPDSDKEDKVVHMFNEEWPIYRLMRETMPQRINTNGQSQKKDEQPSWAKKYQ